MGREGYVGQYMKGVKELKRVKENIAKAETDPSFYDNATKVLIAHEFRLGSGVPSLNEVLSNFEKSDTVDEAKIKLEAQRTRLSDALSTTQNIPDEIFEEMQESLDNTEDFEDKLKDELNKELEKVREIIAESYVNIIHAGLDEMNELNTYLEQLKNPYPYDSRWSIEFFKRGLQSVSDKLRNKNKLDDEGIALCKMLKRDLTWAWSAAKMDEALGPAFELYFAGEMMLSKLRSPHVTLLARDFMRTFSKNVEGLDLTAEQANLVKLTLSKIKNENVGIDVADDPLEAERYRNLQEKGLREVAVEYQDTYGKWLYELSAVNQKNLELGWNESANPATQEEGEHYAKIDEVTFRFLSEVFASNKDLGTDNNLVYVARDGTKYRVKDSLLNHFCMPRNDEKAAMAYQGRMHELVVRNDHFQARLTDLRNRWNTLGPDDRKNALEALAKEVVDAGDKRISTWENLDERNPYDRLADTIIHNLNNFEKGTLGSGDLGWSWVYEKSGAWGNGNDANGDFVYHWVKDGSVYKQEKFYKKTQPSGEWKRLVKKAEDDRLRIQPENQLTTAGNAQVEFVVRRKSELGSIYDNHDVTTVMFMARHIIDYDMLAETRSLIFPPTISWYREMWESQPPYYKPDIKELAANDHELLAWLGLEGSEGILTSGNFLENEDGRLAFKEGEEGKLPHKFGKMDAGVVKFIKENMWAFVVPWLDKPGKKDSSYLVLPVFMPTMVEDMSFQRMVTLEEPSGRVRDHAKATIFHKRLAGAKMSEMNWKNMDKYKFNWVEVTTDQMARWLTPLVVPHEFDRAAKDEVAKQLEMPSGTAHKESGKRKRLGKRAGKVIEGVIRAVYDPQTEIISSMKLSGALATGRTGTDVAHFIDGEWISKWVTPWLNDILDMPGTVRGVSNYSGTAAQVGLVTAWQMEKIIKSAIEHGGLQRENVTKNYQRLKSKKLR